MPSKGITAVVAITLLLMMTIGAAGMAYIFTAGLQTKTQESATGGVRSLQEAASSCMSVDSVYGNKVYLKNCGSGVITGDSLLVYMDGAPINATMFPATITKGEVGTLNLSGIWGLSYDKHTLKIGNGVAQVTQRVVAEPRKDDAAGIWRFDEGSGTTAYDGSGNGNTGTLLPAGSEPTWVSGKFGKGLQFNGINQYITIPNSASLKNYGGGVTYSVWINLNSITANQGILSQYTDPYIDIWFDGTISKLRYEVANIGSGQGASSFVTTNTLSTGIWYYAVLTYDTTTSTLKGYLNGVFQGSSVKTITISPNPNPVLIGNYAGYFNGTIDEVRIYNKALMPDELVNLRAA